MLTMSSYLHEYMVENAKFFHEFDRSSFIANASLALNDKVVDLSLSVKGNQYSHILEKSISHIQEITIDTYAVSEFVSKILGSAKVDAANLNTQDISKADSIYVKPQYLTEAVLTYKEVINNIATGKFTSDDVKSLCSTVDTYIDTLKKRTVSTTAVIDCNPKSLLKHAFLQQNTKVTTKYLEDIVLPFLQEVPKKKKDLITELTIVNSSVCSTVADLKKLTEDITIAISTNKVDDAKKKLLLNYSYNYIRAIMEVVSYLTYAVIKKVHQFEESVVVCQNLYNSLTLLFNGVSTVVEAGVFDKKVITATDANNMAEKLVDGGNDVFAELAHNIMQYHKGYLASHMDDTAEISGTDTESYLSTVLSRNEYNREIYNDIVKAYIEIGNGLDIIAKNCDDRLAIFDELVKKSGFVVMLHDRFHNEIEALEDLSNYGITDLEIDQNQKSDTYFTILAEINDYPDITEQIAKAAKVIYTKAEYVEDLFNNKKNGELAYSETMNELKIFLDSFKDQYRKFNSDIATGLYYRLKALAAKADDCLDNVYSTPESDIYTQDDFFREAVLADLEEMDGINDVIMEVLLKEYYAEREFKERGVRLVYEAEGDNTTVKITDNNTETPANAKNTAATKTSVNNLVNSIGEWFTKMINSFMEIIGREKAKNLKWLAENKEGLTNRSYSNVEIQILPYDRMPSTNVVNDINKLTTNVKAMSAQNIQNIASAEALRSKLINFGPKFKDNDDKVAIINYYKVGNNPVQTVPYANNNIKTLVVNEMIPYCENFYDSYSEGIKKQLSALKDAMAEISKTYVTESVNTVDDMLVFVEAEQPAQTTTTTQTTTTNTENATNTASKAKWMKDCVQSFSGSVLNAIRDRKNDYFKVLFALAPKAKPVAEPTATETNQTPAEEPAAK